MIQNTTVSCPHYVKKTFAEKPDYRNGDFLRHEPSGELPPCHSTVGDRQQVGLKDP
jgi:hypothetical protein